MPSILGLDLCWGHYQHIIHVQQQNDEIIIFFKPLVICTIVRTEPVVPKANYEGINSLVLTPRRLFETI